MALPLALPEDDEEGRVGDDGGGVLRSLPRSSGDGAGSSADWAALLPHASAPVPLAAPELGGGGHERVGGGDIEQRLELKINRVCHRLWTKVARLDADLAVLQAAIPPTGASKVQEQLDAFANTLNSAIGRLEVLTGKVDTQVDICDSIAGKVDRAVDSQSSEMDRCREQLDDVTGKLGDIIGALSDLDERQEQLTSLARTAESDVASYGELLGQLREHVETLDSKLEDVASAQLLEAGNWREPFSVFANKADAALADQSELVAQQTLRLARIVENLGEMQAQQAKIDQATRATDAALAASEDQRLATVVDMHARISELNTSLHTALAAEADERRKVSAKLLSEIEQKGAESDSAVERIERVATEHDRAIQEERDQIQNLAETLAQLRSNLQRAQERQEQGHAEEIERIREALGRSCRDAAAAREELLEDLLGRLQRTESRAQRLAERMDAEVPATERLLEQRLAQAALEVSAAAEARAVATDAAIQSTRRGLKEADDQSRRLASEVAERIDQEREQQLKALRSLQHRLDSVLEPRLAGAERLAQTQGKLLDSHDGRLASLSEQVFCELPRMLDAKLEDARAAAKEEVTASTLNAFQGEVRLWAHWAKLARQPVPPPFHGVAGSAGQAVSGTGHHDVSAPLHPSPTQQPLGGYMPGDYVARFAASGVPLPQ
eukprot:TRINITY_DN56625_c0_g1_i1.p1 TRINITY_DN56625_c0_g1~~TRINITY_DN56625_c0_g1_i1.p1  ORF type:complete len:698 (-),score=121.28 TRINITY_DN56625_c0_g1_i1:269-2281(-)